MELVGKRVLVVGLGKSGQAAAAALARSGASVQACDLKAMEEFDHDAVTVLQKQGVIIHTGGYPQVGAESYDLLVASPGISLEIEPFQAARAHSIPIIGEVELAYQIKKPQVDMLAVTGTNGKTTTTALLEHILKADGRNAAAGGNIGIPLTTLAEEMEQGIIAVEMSSFQLETIHEFKPRVSAMLNITPDHLDRHKTMQAYQTAKARIFENQSGQDYALLNYDDETIRGMAAQCPAKVWFFSQVQTLEEGVFLEQGGIAVRNRGVTYHICGQNEVLLRGRHNMENILCATGVAFAYGIAAEVIGSALKTFPGVRHRLEVAADIDGVLYINDSKATNPDSVIKALDAMDRPVILIAGGRSKGGNFDDLAQLIGRKVKALVLLGEARGELRRAVMDADFQNIYEVETLQDAVDTARRMAIGGDVVLLSPACASWDMFLNYEQRGDLFCNLVKLK